MRKLSKAALALVSALALFFVGSPPASAFGGEVLGCSAGFGWTAGSCHSSASLSSGTLLLVTFEAHNTSGTYDTSWAFTPALNGTCNSSFTNVPCAYSGNTCTAGSVTCQIATRVTNATQTYTAALTLTQSGQTRTVTATATVKESIDGGCRLC
jgi:hypothetical protein